MICLNRESFIELEHDDGDPATRLVEVGEEGVMSFVDRMDAQHRQALESIPAELVDLSDIPRARRTFDR